MFSFLTLRRQHRWSGLCLMQSKLCLRRPDWGQAREGMQRTTPFSPEAGHNGDHLAVEQKGSYHGESSIIKAGTFCYNNSWSLSQTRRSGDNNVAWQMTDVSLVWLLRHVFTVDGRSANFHVSRWWRKSYIIIRDHKISKPRKPGSLVMMIIMTAMF